MPRIVAVVNQKGGCGKTTVVMNLAGGLQKAGYKVGVVDLDRQESAKEWGGGGMAFDVWTFQQLAGQSLDRMGYDIILLDLPPGIAEDDEVGGDAEIARLWAAMADFILVPLKPAMLDFRAAAKLVRYLQVHKPLATQVAVVINLRRNTALSRDAREKAAQLFQPLRGTLVFETSIALREPLAEVAGSGSTIFDYAPRSEAAREFAALTKEVIQWLVAQV